MLGAFITCFSVNTASAQSERPYRIVAGDVIEVNVWGEERLQRDVRILPDGTFVYPLVGQVVAQGLLPSEVQDAISKGLASQYRGEVPQVTVSVKEATGTQFSVVGRVKSPGTFTPGRYVTLLDAIALAGGGDEFANLDNITIIRKTAQGMIVIKARMGAVMKGSVDTKELAAGRVPEIQGGDTVIVP
tara:strand:+ start:100208 stop:100771 length:564 start_codon:yes stop_codon:yes gene_type:complete